MTLKHVVVPVDGSAEASRAAQFAARIVGGPGAGPDGKITLLYVYNAPAVAMLGLEAQSAEEMERIKNAMAKGSFDAARQAIGEVPVPVATHVTVGHPAREIVTYADVHRADLVAMGRRGLSNIESMVLGSVSDYVVRHARCPVTIVR